MQKKPRKLVTLEIGTEWESFLPTDTTDPVSNEISVALQQADNVIRAQEDRIRLLEAMVKTDELTGITNRRGFMSCLERELALTRRNADTAGMLVMIDLDRFKIINDTYGHQAGDAYLCAVAQVLQKSVRASDTVARLGGDEFALLLTHLDEEIGAKRVAKLGRAFNARSMMWNGRPIPLRASFGFSAYVGSDSPKQVMHRADVRLYAQKTRNDRTIASAV